MKELTGKDLTGDAWVDCLKEPVAHRIMREKREYEEMLDKIKAKGSGTPEAPKDIDLMMEVNFVDGDEVISSTTDGGLLAACKRFEEFVGARVAAAASS